MHAGTRRPQWSVVDEAHHILPAAHFEGTAGLPQSMRACNMVHSEQVVRGALLWKHYAAGPPRKIAVIGPPWQQW
ncbi:MAG: hypothetical protein ACJ8H8_15420 [Geminicoccaceae bacterium]